ncbi:MAG: hypothetical protein HY279_13630 [Nitrospinae bacterium]|nr:hypothetical protein [Nitrospinota bacterium]
MRYILTVFLTICFLSLPHYVLADKNPHDFIDDQSKCIDCHRTKPESLPVPGKIQGNVDFKIDFNNMCNNCHRHEGGKMGHPVGVKPKAITPADLLLDENGKLTCLTCHKTHMGHIHKRKSLSICGGLFSSGEERSYFLRRDNSEGDLCLACHG